MILAEGSTAALNTPVIPQAEAAKYAQLSFVVADNAKLTLSLRLAEPRDALASYRSAVR